MTNSTHLMLSGRPVAAQIHDQIKNRLTKLHTMPKLVIFLVGENPSSLAYIGRKQKIAQKLGLQTDLRQFNISITEEQLLIEIEKQNQEPTTNGIIVQLPLPSHITIQKIIDAVAPAKDVDGLTISNLGSLLVGYPHLIPATALGVLQLLDYYRISVAGQRVLVIGRSRLVGQPLAQLLLQHGATVTIAHRQTQHLKSFSQEADILISAAGSPNLITRDMIKPGATIIDVGLTPTDEGLKGDVATGVADIAGAMTPVPGGVGPLTVACLMQNLLQAAEEQMENHHD